MAFDNVLQTIGNTPHIRINKLFGSTHQVYVKSERSNPGGSIKDRIALAMIEDAENSGALKPGATIIEPTSGNTGVGLALVAAVKGYKLILVMPDSMSVERRRLMLAYGASFDLTPREKGMKGAIARADELAAATPDAPEAGTDETVLVAEEAARSLKRLELSGRRIGDPGRYEGSARGFLDALAAMRNRVPDDATTGLRRIDIARLAEILCGREAAVRMLEGG